MLSETLRLCLRNLGYSPVITAVTPLTDGASGSQLYKLSSSSGDVIFKYTPASSNEQILARAQRELNFYRSFTGDFPVALPTFLGGTSDKTGTCLLLGAYRKAPPATNWTSLEFTQLVRQLAQLHARFWDRTSEFLTFPWLRDLVAATSEAEQHQAQQAWLTLAEQSRLGDLLKAPILEHVLGSITRVAELELQMADIPLTLCHGDFHTANLLWAADGQFIWADWQEVGLGYGPEDLSFFIQRASHEGAHIDTDLLVFAYHHELATILGTDISLSTIEKVVATSELRTQLLFWPHYVHQAAPHQVAAIISRIHSLTAKLFV